MAEKETQIPNPIEKSENLKSSRPFLLSLVSVFSFIFFGIITLLFLLALFNVSWILDITEKYLPDSDFSKGKAVFYIIAGFLLHSIALAGIIYIWKGRKTGYYLFSISSILLASFQLLSNKISVLTTAVYISLVLLFGIFYRRLK
jgi:hypothetical protein